MTKKAPHVHSSEPEQTKDEASPSSFSGAELDSRLKAIEATAAGTLDLLNSASEAMLSISNRLAHLEEVLAKRTGPLPERCSAEGTLSLEAGKPFGVRPTLNLRKVGVEIITITPSSQTEDGGWAFTVSTNRTASRDLVATAADISNRMNGGRADRAMGTVALVHLETELAA